MRAFRVLALFVAVFPLSCSSSSSGENPNEALQQCMSESVFDLMRVANRLADLLRRAQGLPSSGKGTFDPSTDPTDPANTYDFSIPFDVSGDGSDDTTIAGTATFPGDPMDGLNPGEIVNTNFTVNPSGASPGPLSGDGFAAIRIETTTDVSITGTTDLANGDCSARLSTTTQGPLLIGFTLPIAANPAATSSAIILDPTVSGVLSALVTKGSNTADGMLDIDDASQDAVFTGMVNGTEKTLSFPIFPSPQTIDLLAQCVQQQFLFYNELAAIFQRAAADIEALGGPAENLELPGIALEDTGSSVGTFNYSIDTERYGNDFTSGLIQGQMRRAGGASILYRFSWSLEVVSQSAGDIVTGSSARFFDVTLGSPGSITAEGTLSAPGCLGGFDVPENDPIVGNNQSGTITLRSQRGDDTLVATFTVTFLQNYASATINGIPMPQGAFGIFPN